MLVVSLVVLSLLITNLRSPHKRRSHSSACMLRLALLFILLVSTTAVPTAVDAAPVAGVAGVIDFANPANLASAKAELDHAKSLPFTPSEIVAQFAHSIDSHLPHGSRTAPATSEYWVDPETKLVHHRLPHLTDHQFQQLVQVTRQYADSVVAYTLEQVTGYTGDASPMSIDLGGTPRVFQPPRRNYSPAELDIMQAKVEELVSSGHVQPLESSDFACNVVLAAKRAPDGTWSDKRFCVNFIPINKHTTLDNYGSHKADTLLQHASRKAYLTAIDLRSGFHQIHMDVADICKTAFWYVRKNLPPILMAYNRMPFGLKNASAKFQRVMDHELQKHGCTEFAFAYIDDLIIASDTWEEHVEHVRKVLKMLKSCGLKIHPSKSIFGSNVLEYLGHNVIGKQGIAMNEAKVAALKALPTPTNLLELRSVLGFMSYYRHFIPGFSSLCEPMVQLLRKNAPFNWGPDQQAAYQSLKNLMSKPGLVLRPVDPEKQLMLHTDWSTRGIGAVLGQLDDKGQEYLCACISRSLNKHERNYPAYKGELLALTWAVQSFRAHLHGVHFVLYTDHRPLTWLMAARDLTGQYSRWQMMLQEYDFKVVHRPGLSHQNADTLSRFPRPEHVDATTGTQLDPEQVVCAIMCRPAFCLTMFQSRGQGGHSGLPDVLDSFCPTFSALLGAGSAHPDPVYYSHHVMRDEPDQPGIGPELVPHREHDPIPPELGDDADAHSAMRSQARVCIMQSMVDNKCDIRERLWQVKNTLHPRIAGLKIDRKPVAKAFLPGAYTDGVTVIELCAGICTGLEAVLLTGMKVNHYLYVDIDPLARKVASFRVNNFVSRFPHQLTPLAIQGCFGLPQDLRLLSMSDIHDRLFCLDQYILVMAGWPCQDYSAAGKGRLGHRASLLQDVVRIIITLQQASLRFPVAYLLENVCMQHNFNHEHIRTTAADHVFEELGEPVVLDAVNAGSYAMRRRNYWTNLADQVMLSALCAKAVLHHKGDLYDVLLPGREPCPVTDAEPAGSRNHPGQTRRVWPTLMSYHRSRSFLPGAPGSIIDTATGESLEPMAVERELAMGFEPSSTAAPGVTDGQRCALLGQAIDLNALFMILEAVRALHDAGLAAPSSKAAWRATADHGSTQLAVMTMLPEDSVQRTVIQTSAEASNDVWLDHDLLQYLRTGASMHYSRRVARRAKSYMWFNNRLHRIVADAYTGEVTYRQVPEPATRDGLVLDCHIGLGHIGEKRTIAAMAQTYWWYGMTLDIRRVLSGCKLCARVHASSGEQPRDMVTIVPAEYGMFHRWGLDYAQDLPTSALGNSHCLIMIDYFSKWVEAVPTADVSSGTTTNAFHLHVCARFGLPAEVITDNGSAFKGQFADFCARKLIHHRLISEDLPRSNGLAERAVQTLKAALRKHAAASHNALSWDTDGLTAILTGYRCTPQSATGHSPARILFALDPVLDAEQYYSRRGQLDLTGEVSVEAVAADLLQRAALASEVGSSVAHNLRTAHERDCRRFKARRLGLYVPRLHHFKPGDYVFVLAQGQKPGGTLGIRARNEVLKVTEVRDSGVLLLENQAGSRIEKHHEHCVPCLLPNLVGDTYAGLVKPHADLPCQVCNDHRHWAHMLLCDNCDTGWHIYCLDPPLEEVPPGQWVCPDCVSAGVTLQSLAEKQGQYIADPITRPNLELPSRRRVARARQYLEQWHGKAVSRTRNGVTRHGRVVFLGVLADRWFRILWDDGTYSDHNAAVLRTLEVLDSADVPVPIPDAPAPPVLWCRMAEQMEDWAMPDTPGSMAALISNLMGSSADCDEFVALDTLTALNASLTAQHRPVTPLPDVLWRALSFTIPLQRIGHCFLPLCSGGTPTQLLHPEFGRFDNHPSPNVHSSLHLNPYLLSTHRRNADAGFSNSYYLDIPAPLLDLLLPLAHSFASHITIALVPVAWLRAKLAHRVVWLHDDVWTRRLGLFVHVRGPASRVLPVGWLLLFPDTQQRDVCLGGRVPDLCTECLWDAARPYCLQFVSSLPSTAILHYRRSSA